MGAGVIRAVHTTSRQATSRLRNVRGGQNQTRIGWIDGDVADARAAIAVEAESEIAVGSDEGTCGACHGTSLRPVKSAIGGFQNASAIVNVETDGSLLTGAGVNDSGASGIRRVGKGDRSHREGRILIADGSPSAAAVGGAPDAALSATNEYCIAGRVAGIDGNGLYLSADLSQKPAGCGRGTKRGPSPTDGRTSLRSRGSIASIGLAHELSFGFHHALPMLEGLEARASGNVAAYGAALLVEPFLALANELGAVSIIPFFCSAGLFRWERGLFRGRLAFRLGRLLCGLDARTTGSARFFLAGGDADPDCQDRDEQQRATAQAQCWEIYDLPHATESASSRRSDTLSLSKILCRWFLTVCSEMKSFSPISLLRNHCATSCTISFSRSLSNGFSRRGPDSLDFENAFMTSAVMRLSSQISPACTR